MIILRSSIVFALLAICAVVLAQNTASSTQAATNNTSVVSASATASPTQGGNTTASNSTMSGNSTAALGNSTVASTTPTSFPVATVPSTGYLAGTASAPAPAGGAGSGSSASGPNDSHVVSAAFILSPAFAAVTASVFSLVIGISLLL